MSSDTLSELPDNKSRRPREVAWIVLQLADCADEMDVFLLALYGQNITPQNAPKMDGSWLRSDYSDDRRHSALALDVGKDLLELFVSGSEFLAADVQQLLAALGVGAQVVNAALWVLHLLHELFELGHGLGIGQLGILFHCYIDDFIDFLLD